MISKPDDGAPVTPASEPTGTGETNALGYAAFLSRVAHDLRSPIGVVMHVLSQIGTDLEGSLKDEHRTWLKLGSRSARRMQNQLDRLSLLAELESKRLVLTLQRVDLRDIVSGAVDASLSTEPRSEVHTTWNRPETPSFVLADPRLLTRAVQELVRNAVAHARSAVRIDLEPGADCARVSVEDDGNGIDPRALGTLFVRFGCTPGEKDSGVGLSIAREVISMQHGELTVGSSTLTTSRPGKVGARFTISLPNDSRSA